MKLPELLLVCIICVAVSKPTEGVCTFARGHVSGAQENIGMSNSADECGVKARRKRPRANGATWSSDGTKWCYAHVGPVSFIAGTEGREGCLYQESEELWRMIPNADVLCSEDDNSFEVRIDRIGMGSDCNALCNSVELQCLDGLGDYDNTRCPTAEEITSIGCDIGHQSSFVCSCKKL